MLLAASTWVGCDGTTSKTPGLELPQGWIEKVPGDIYLAGLFSYTGVWSVGQGQEQGAVTALTEINAQGGIDGKMVGLLTADDKGDRTNGLSLLEALYASRDVGAVIGSARSIVMIGSGSGTETGVAQLSVEKGVMMVSPSATSPVIGELEDKGYIFRTCPSDDVQSLAAAKVAIREGFNRVFVAQTAGDAATIGVRKVFVSNFEAVKGQGFAPFYEFANTQTNYATDILNQAKSKWPGQIPDAILLASFTADSATIINAASTFDWGAGGARPKWLMVDGSKEAALVTSLSSPNLLTEANAFGVVPATPSGADYNTFAASHQQIFQTAPLDYAANTYDAAYLIAGAMQLSADPLKGELLKTAILKTGPVAGAPANPALKQFHPGQWAAMSAELKASGAVDYQGASGNVDFNARGDVFSNINEWTVKDGTIQLRPGKCWTPAGTTCP